MGGLVACMPALGSSGGFVDACWIVVRGVRVAPGSSGGLFSRAALLSDMGHAPSRN